MQKSAIREMYSGFRGTYDHIKLSPDYEEARNKMSDAVDTFLEKLTPEQQKHFHEAYEFMSNTEAEYAADHFIEGFKFGLLIGIEVGEKPVD